MKRGRGPPPPVSDSSGCEEVEDDVSDVSEEEEVEAAPAPPAAATKPAKKQRSTDARYQAPTLPEAAIIRQVSATENISRATELDRGAIVSLEVEEILGEARVDYISAPVAAIEKIVAALAAFLKATEDQEGVSAETLGLPGLVLADRAPKPVTLDYAAPTDVKIIGSFALKTLVRPGCCVDVAVLMPAACFHNRDMKNHVYGDKRALYLGVLASLLPAFPDCATVQLEALAQCIEKPVLRVTLKSKSPFALRLIPVMPAGVFKRDLLLAGHGNVRRTTHESEPQPETPMYNAWVMEDMVALDLCDALRTCLAASPVATNTAVLLKTFLRRKGLTRRPDSVSGFLITVIVAHMASVGVLLPSMAPHQALKAALGYLATNSLSSASGAAIVYGKSPAAAAAAAAAFVKCFDCVVLDSSCSVNVASRVSTGACVELQQECARALAALGGSPAGRRVSPSPASVRAALVDPVPPAAAFDHCVCVSLPPGPLPGVALPGPSSLKDQNSLCDVSWARVMERRVAYVVTKALGDRVTAVRVLAVTNSDDAWGMPERVAWDAAAPPPSVHSLLLGIQLDAEKWSRGVDRGPPAVQREAAHAFRAFWGELAELRRFPDGAIVEAIDWGVPRVTRSLLLSKVITHVLGRHCGVAPAGISSPWAALGALLEAPHVTRAALAGQTPTDDSYSCTQACVAAFESLSKTVRGLTGMPIPVATLVATAPELRGTSAYPLQAHPLAGGPMPTSQSIHTVARTVTPLEVMLTMETRAGWPDDISAIQATISALYLRLKSRLKSSHDVRSIVTREYLDVLHEGFLFRLRIFHPRALELLQESVRSKAKYVTVPDGFVAPSVSTVLISRGLVTVRPEGGNPRSRPRSGSVTEAPTAPSAALFHMLTECVKRPAHAANIKGFARTHVGYAGAVRLAVRWCGAHMFGDHFSQEAIELLVASVFTNTVPCSPPVSPAVAFLRFLRLLARWNWANAPLCVDVTGTGTAEGEAALLSHFQGVRASKSASGGPGGPALFLVTPLESDTWNPVWTHSSPSPAVLRRAVTLAEQSYTRLCVGLVSRDAAAAVAEAFAPNTADFHAVIRLRDTHLPRADGRAYGQVDAVGVGEWLARSGVGADKAGKGKEAHTHCGYVVPLTKESRQSLLRGFNPLKEYVTAVRASYHKQLEVFWDPQAPSQLGLVWLSRGFGGVHPAAALEGVVCETAPAPGKPKGKKGKGAPAPAPGGPSLTFRSVKGEGAPAVAAHALSILQDVVMRGHGVVLDAVLL